MALSVSINNGGLTMKRLVESVHNTRFIKNSHKRVMQNAQSLSKKKKQISHLLRTRQAKFIARSLFIHFYLFASL